MTDETRERILVSKCGKTLVHDGMKQYETDVQYIRADHAQTELQAAVAAEREACAKLVDEYKDRADDREQVSRGVGKWGAAERHSSQSGAAVSIASAIRARSSVSCANYADQEEKY